MRCKDCNRPGHDACNEVGPLTRAEYKDLFLNQYIEPQQCTCEEARERGIVFNTEHGLCEHCTRNIQSGVVSDPTYIQINVRELEDPGTEIPSELIEAFKKRWHALEADAVNRIMKLLRNAIYGALGARAQGGVITTHDIQRMFIGGMGGTSDREAVMPLRRDARGFPIININEIYGKRAHVVITDDPFANGGWQETDHLVAKYCEDDVRICAAPPVAAMDMDDTRYGKATRDENGNVIKPPKRTHATSTLPIVYQTDEIGRLLREQQTTEEVAPEPLAVRKPVVPPGMDCRP